LFGPPESGAVSPKFASVQSTPSVKNRGWVIPQPPELLPPLKPKQAVRRTSSVPLKLQRSSRFAQKVPPDGVNGGKPLLDALVDDELLAEVDELELLLDELGHCGIFTNTGFE
jgi:hypothetical protein